MEPFLQSVSNNLGFKFGHGKDKVLSVIGVTQGVRSSRANPKPRSLHSFFYLI